MNSEKTEPIKPTGMEEIPPKRKIYSRIHPEYLPHDENGPRSEDLVGGDKPNTEVATPTTISEANGDSVTRAGSNG